MVRIADMIKYEGDNSTFVWKHPREDFNTATQLVVHESQEAIFFLNGQALDLFGAGRYNGAKNYYDGIDSNIKNNYTQGYVNNVFVSINMMYNCGSQIDRIFEENVNVGKLAADAWKNGIELHTKILPYLTNVDENKRTISSYVEKIGKYDKRYAEDYFFSDKKKQLVNQITTLQNQISAAHSPDSSLSAFGLIIFSAVFLIGGISSLILCFFIDSSSSLYNFIVLIFACFGIGFGGYFFFGTLKIIINTPKEVATAENELKRVQSELAELQRKHDENIKSIEDDEEV